MRGLGIFAFEVASLVTLLSKAKAKAVDRRVTLSEKVTELVKALRSKRHVILAANIEKQCRPLLDS
jgi:hypothetical protein